MNNRLVEPANNGLRDASVMFITVIFIGVFFLAFFRLDEPTITAMDDNLPCAQYDMSRGERISDAWDEHMMEHPERIQKEVVSLLSETTKAHGLEGDLKSLAGSIASELKNQTKYAQSIEVYQALLQTEQRVAQNDRELLDTYNNLANVYIAAKNFTKAEEALQTALSITENSVGKDSYEVPVAQCLDRLADLQAIQKNYTKELALRNKAHDIRVKEYGSDSSFLVQSYNDLADLALRTGDKNKAECLYKQGLMIADKQHPSGSEARELRRKIRSLHEEPKKNPETPKK